MEMTGAVSGFTLRGERSGLHRGGDGEIPLGPGEGDGRTVLFQHGIAIDPMCRVEKLTGFQEHFHNVFVHMPSGRLAGIRMKGEDVHGGHRKRWGCQVVNFMGESGGGGEEAEAFKDKN